MHRSAGNSTDVQVLVPCPAAAAHHTRVCAIYPVCQPTDVHPVIDKACFFSLLTIVPTTSDYGGYLSYLYPHILCRIPEGTLHSQVNEACLSNLAIDQAHDKHNAVVNDDGGAVVLTECPAALQRWMVSGPEMARIINDFER